MPIKQVEREDQCVVMSFAILLSWLFCPGSEAGLGLKAFEENFTWRQGRWVFRAGVIFGSLLHVSSSSKRSNTKCACRADIKESFL